MGDLQSWLPRLNGFLNDFNPSISSLPPPLNPNFLDIREESWRIGERATQGVIENIQATAVSEKRRQEVVEYVQQLIKYNLDCEVFPFGSVPLKTYLPDGDIDLTAISLPSSEETLASDVRHVLEAEERNNDVKFEVKDVQYIHAEVKLVKCLVQNIVVDISFNQSGGLSTLCFLEKVDRLIGKDHIFKRSIILIKAWCYYESRILGAHHGLISTYALETLVLYIFHLFNSSLDGPLAVLYRFLDYYSKFDWDRYCISLYGPVSISSLPELVAERPENNGGDLLFTKEFLKKCVESFSVLTRGLESPSRVFPKKHLNIVDPLKENNNLGRSVSRGNFYRIRSAFTYGARKLGRILLLSSESIATEVNMFFANTLDRHGSGERPDVQDTKWKGELSESQAIDANGELCEELNAIKLSGLEKESGSRVSDGRDKSKVLVSTSEKNITPNGKACHIPHLFFQSKNEYQNGRLDQAKSVSSARPLPSNEEVSYISQPYFIETESSMRSASMRSASFSSHVQSSHTGSAGAERNRASGSSKSKKLADLSGDFDMHNKNFQYAQYNQEYIRGAFFPYYTQSPTYQYHNNSSWDPHWQHGAVAHMNTNGVAYGSPFSPSGTYPITHPFISGPYGMEDLPKPRGTGTYFPNMNYHTYKERHSPGRGKNSVAMNHFSRYRNNVQADTHQDDNLEGKGNHEPPPQLQLPVYRGYGRGKIAHLDVSNSPRPLMKETSPANSCISQPEGGLEFGSFGPVQLGAPSSEPGRRLDSVSPHTQGSGLTIPASTMQRPTASSNRERSALAYQLKDEGDFPPLNG